MPGLEVLRNGPEDAEVTAVLVHGAWHGAWAWQEGFVQRLADQGVATVAPSLRGHGNSPGRDRLNRHRLRHYVEDVLEVVAALPAPPVLVGHSMGGGVVQHVLSRTDRPPLAAAALLATMPPAGVWRVTTRIATRETGAFLAANATLDLGRLVARPEQVRHRFLSADAPDTLVESLRQRLQSESYLAFLDMLALDRPRPRPVDEPVLVVGAADDTIFRVEDEHATAAAWGTTATIVDDLAHDVMLDTGWEQVADLVAEFALRHAT